MKITRTEIYHTADLACLHLREDEIPGILSDLKTILDYFNKLQALDTQNIPPFRHPRDGTPLMRKDEPGISLSQKDVLKNAPAAEAPFFKAPTE